MTPQILSYFCTMKDPRIDRKKLHPLDAAQNFIFLMRLPVLTGKDFFLLRL